MLRVRKVPRNVQELQDHNMGVEHDVYRHRSAIALLALILLDGPFDSRSTERSKEHRLADQAATWTPGNRELAADVVLAEEWRRA